MLGQDSISAKADSVKPVITLKQKKTEAKTVSSFKPNPQRAMLLSCFIPGGGQIYNRSYWKAPLVWGGYAALIYAISWNTSKYNKYHKAYISIADNDSTTNDYMQYIPVGKTDDPTTNAWLRTAIKQKNDSYRRSRDYSILGMIGFYGLTILDSYVDAQLYDFDINPNLSIHIEPVLFSSGLINNNSIGLNCSLTF